MERALNHILISDDVLVALVSGRISPIKRDEGFPAVTYEKTNREEDRDVAGRVVTPIRSNFSVTVRDTQYTPAKNIADEVIRLLSQYRGKSMDIEISHTRFNDESTDQTLEPDITEVILDFTFFHN